MPAPLARWRAARDAIYGDIWDNFWDPDEQAFVGHKGSTQLDAACLLMPLVRFVSPTDPRWLATLRAVERRLAHDSLVHRYEIVDEKVDGLAGTEGTFSICSFWVRRVPVPGGRPRAGAVPVREDAATSPRPSPTSR